MWIGALLLLIAATAQHQPQKIDFFHGNPNLGMIDFYLGPDRLLRDVRPVSLVTDASNNATGPRYIWFNETSSPNRVWAGPARQWYDTASLRCCTLGTSEPVCCCLTRG